MVASTFCVTMDADEFSTINTNLCVTYICYPLFGILRLNASSISPGSSEMFVEVENTPQNEQARRVRGSRRAVAPVIGSPDSLTIRHRRRFRRVSGLLVAPVWLPSGSPGGRGS